MRIGRIQNNYTAAGFDLVKNTNLEFIEICCNDAEAAANFVAAKESVKAEMARTGIDISCVGRWNHDVNENGTINEEKFAGYIALMDAAIELGAKTFVCGINESGEIDLEANYAIAVECAGYIARIGVENLSYKNLVTYGYDCAFHCYSVGSSLFSLLLSWVVSVSSKERQISPAKPTPL